MRDGNLAPLSTIFANIFVQLFEQRVIALVLSEFRPGICLRYVGGTFVVFMYKDDNQTDFF